MVFVSEERVKRAVGWNTLTVADGSLATEMVVVEPAPVIKVLSSSIASDTSELVSMREQVKRGRPVEVYELQQNNADYSTERPSITIIDMADGTHRIFNGKTGQVDLEKELIKAVRMISFGEGMLDVDTVLFSHGGGKGTYGVNGRGGSVCYGYLVSEGMEVQIASNRGGVTFVGEVEMVDIPEKPGVQRMQFVYSDAYRVWNGDERLTQITIREPTRGFMESLYKSPEIFLHANPKYADAKLVKPDADAIRPESVVVWSKEGRDVRVECLLGLPGEEFRVIEPTNNIRVGGLLVQTDNYEKMALPWAIWGGEHFGVHDEERVGRSKDSLKAEGYYRQAIHNYLTRTTSKEVLGALLSANNLWVLKQNAGFTSMPVELETPIGSSEPSDETARVFRELLMEQFGGKLPIVVTGKREYVELSRKFGKEEPVLQLTSYANLGLYMAAGCKSGESILEIEKRSTAGGFPLGWVSDARGVEVLAEMVGTTAMKAFTRDGNLAIGLEDRDLMNQMNLDCLTSTPQSGSKLSRLLESVGYLIQKGCSVRLTQVKGGRITSFDFTGWVGSRTGALKNESEVRLVATAKWDLTGDYPDGLTMEFVVGDDNDLRRRIETTILPAISQAVKEGGFSKKIDEMSEVELREELKKRERERLATIKKERQVKQTMDQFRRLVRGDITFENWLDGTRTEAAEFNFQLVESRHSLGVSNLESFKIFDYDLGRLEVNGVGVSTADYYVTNIADDFRIVDGRVSEVFNGEWEKLYGVTRSPDQWQIATVVQVRGGGLVEVPIKRSMNDVTFLSEPGIEVVIDRKNKLVRVRNTDPLADVTEVAIYQRRCKKGLFVEDGPKDINYNVRCAIEDIDEPLATELRKIKNNKKLSPADKNAMVTILHQKTFTYSDKHEIERDIMTGCNDMGTFESRLINRGAGICNYSAARLSIMMRLCGLPTKVVGGVVTSTQELKSKNSHSWVKCWNGKRWYDVESAAGLVSLDVAFDIASMGWDDFSISDGTERMREGVRGMTASGVSPDVAARIVYSGFTDNINSLRSLLHDSPEIVRQIIERIKDPETREAVRKLVGAGIIMAAETVAMGANKVAEKQRKGLIRS